MVERPTDFTTESEKTHVRDILNDYLSKSESFHYKNDKVKFKKWKDELMHLIKENFTSNEIANYFKSEAEIVFSRMIIAGMSEEDSIISYELATERKALRFILDNIGKSEEISESNAQGKNIKSVGKKIFIVHGHDGGARDAVARTVSELGLDPIILHEKPNQGATLIEKFEKNADVGFAIIIVTPDDVGRAKDDDTLMDRARQNVILELGYFVGRLKRKRVMVLRKGDVEVPSDIFGMVYEPLDDAGAWRFKLGAELKAAGYSIDLNKLA